MEKNQKNLKLENILLSFVPRLSAYRSKSGRDCTTYFVDNKYVIKKYERKRLEFSFFDKYCREIKKFSFMGLNVPKVFAWLNIPSFNSFGENSNFFYILQENVEGSRLYNFDISLIEQRFKKFCSHEEFNKTLSKKLDENEFLNTILKAYINSFISTNDSLLIIDESKVSDFVGTLLSMKKKSRFSSPDLVSENVVFNRELGSEKLTLTDNILLGGELDEEDRKYAKIDTACDILELFNENQQIRTVVEPYLSECSDKSKKDTLEYLLNFNDKLAVKNAMSWLSVLFNMSGRLIAGEDQYESFKELSESVLGDDKSKKLCREIEREY